MNWGIARNLSSKIHLGYTKVTKVWLDETGLPKIPDFFSDKSGITFGTERQGFESILSTFVLV